MRRALLLALAVLAALGAAPLARAAGGSSLSVAARAGGPARLALVARLHGASRGATVAFFVVSREFGDPRNVPIGVAKVGASGTARIDYRPTWSGVQQFVAKLAGGPTATAAYRVAAAAPGPLHDTANPGRPLASVGHVFLDVILSVAALVWLSLAVTLVLAFARLPRLAGEGTD